MYANIHIKQDSGQEPAKMPEALFTVVAGQS